jgi:energy-coupling factor transport system substrate-specific component
MAFSASVWAALRPGSAGLSLLLAAGALLVAGFAWLETGPGSAKEIALVATLAGVAAAGRVLFQAVPGVQPVTVVTVAAGALAALVSNFFLGQGTWTPWQMLAWGLCGVVGGLLAPLLRGRVSLAAVCLVLGFAFSTLMDVWLWLSFYPHTWEALAVVVGRGIWFSGAHAAGNVVLALVAGPELRRLLERYARRLKTEVVWA